MDYVITAFSDSWLMAEVLCNKLSLPIISPDVVQFADGEIAVSFDDHRIRSAHVFVIHTAYGHIHDFFMRLCFLARAALDARALSVTLVVPYLWYTRQHMSNGGAWQMMMQCMRAAGIVRIIAFALHEPAIVKVSQPVAVIDADEFDIVLAGHIRQHVLEKNFVVVAPDQGAHERVKKIGSLLNRPTYFLHKERKKNGEIEVTGLSKNEDIYQYAVIVDDIIDTGNTALAAYKILKEARVRTVYGYFIHCLSTSYSLKRLIEAGFSRLFISNSVERHFVKEDNVSVFDISSSLVATMQRILEVG